VWIAIATYVLVSIVKKRLGLVRSLSEILQILSISLFEQVAILQALTPLCPQTQDERCHNHLVLFEF